MKLAIMQPYFFPYIGYFQLVNAVDEFVIYDNIKYTKKGWINRNRILSNQKDEYITIPLKKGSDSQNIIEKKLADTFDDDKEKILRKVSSSYKHAPHFNATFQLVEDCLNCNDVNNLFSFIHYSIKRIVEQIGINTKISISSNIEQNEIVLKGQDRVINICRLRNSDIYINPIGGLGLYDKSEFNKHKINLYFLKTNPIEYKQFGKVFLPNLSMIDVMMFNSLDNIRLLIKKYELI